MTDELFQKFLSTEELRCLHDGLADTELAREIRLKLEKTLRASESKYRYLYEESPAIIIVIGKDLNIKDINKAGLKQLGYSKEELLLKPMRDIIEHKHQNRVIRAFSNAFSGDSTKKLYVQLVAKNGLIHTILFSPAQVFTQTKDSVAGILVTGMDVTQRLQIEDALRESKARYRLVLDKMNDGFAIQTEAGKLAYVNKRFCEMLGYNREEIIGRPPSDFLNEENQRIIMKETAKRQKERGENYDLVWERKTGDQIHTLISPAELKDTNGRYLGSFAVITDITHRIKAEDIFRAFAVKIEKLHEVARLLAACTSESEILNLTTDAVERVLKFTTYYLTLEKDEKLILTAKSDDLSPDIILAINMDDNIIIKTLKTGKITIFDSPDDFPPVESIRKKFTSGLSAPISDIGVIQVFSRGEDIFNNEDARLLALLLGHMAEAIKRIRLQKQLKKQALHDPLTGLHNRYFLEQTLKTEVKRSQRYRHTLTFIIIDVDRFKEINDRFGHDVGDQVLQYVANLIEQEIRGYDFLIRFGGDEFLIIMPENKGEVDAVKKRIAHKLKAKNEMTEKLGFQITLSIGSASWNPVFGETVDEVLARADKRMYELKRAKKKNV